MPDLMTAPVQQPGITPVADANRIRYTTPAVATDPSLNDLATGLSKLDSGLSNFMDGRQAKQDAADKLQGEADFQRNNAQGYSQGVADGTIPASNSPAWVSAYKNAQGQLAGDTFASQFAAAYDAWDGKGNTDDPNAYTKFAQDFAARNIGTTDPQVLAGFMPKVTATIQLGQKQHIADQHETVVNGLKSTYGAIVNQGIGAGVAAADSGANGGVVDPTYVTNQVASAYNKAVSLGMNLQEAQKEAVEQITTAALANPKHGHEILQALDVAMPGNGITLGQTTYGAAKKVMIANELDRMDRETHLHAEEDLKKANVKDYGVAETAAQDFISKNPGQPIPDDVMAAGVKADPAFRLKVAEWQDTFGKNLGVSDPQSIVTILGQVDDGIGPEALRHAMDLNVIRNPKDYETIKKAIEDHAKADPVMGPLMGSESYKAIQKQIQDQTADGGVANVFGTKGLSKLGLGLQSDLQHAMQEWANSEIAKGHQPNFAETQDQLQSVWSNLQKNITRPANGMAPGEGVLRPGNPLGAPASTVPSTAQAPQVAPTAPVLPQGFTEGPIAPAPGVANDPNAPLAVRIQAERAAEEAAADQPAAVAPPPQPQMGMPTANPTPAPTADQGAALQAPPLPPPTPAQITPATVTAWMGGLSPVQQANLAKEATRTGKTPTEVATAFLTKQPAALAAPPPAPSVDATSLLKGAMTPPPPVATPAAPVATSQSTASAFQDAVAKWRATDPDAEAKIHQFTALVQGMHAALPYKGSLTVAAIKDNPQAAHLLDFVAGPESNGNYNAYYSHANSQTDLSHMTLNQVLQFQHDLVSVDKLPSSATGRYQFMPDTLKSLMQENHLTGNEKFTPEMQDSLALSLLKRRGLESWQQGKITDGQFANNLAYEWASLPNVNTGMSQYHGDGLNKSLVTPGQVMNRLTEAKGMPAGIAGPPDSSGTAGPMSTPALSATSIAMSPDERSELDRLGKEMAKDGGKSLSSADLKRFGDLNDKDAQDYLNNVWRPANLGPMAGRAEWEKSGEPDYSDPGTYDPRLPGSGTGKEERDMDFYKKLKDGHFDQFIQYVKNRGYNV